MLFRQLNPGSCRTYLVASVRTHEAGLIDPVLGSAESYLQLLREQGLTLRWVLDTHTHADHLSGCAALQKAAQVEYLMHSSSAVQCVSRRLQDGESLGLGEVTLKFTHVPGHTQDSLMVLLPDRFLSGDFLFIGQGGAGRLDLPGGDADAHYESLRKLDALRAETLMFPAHDYRGHLQSTLAAERASNPVLQPRSREEYLRWWRGLRLGPADWMREVLKANAGCTCDPNAVKVPAGGSACEACAPAPAAGGMAGAASVPEWSARELGERLAKAGAGGCAVVDVREPDEYAGELGHIRGSRLVPLGQLGDRLSEVPKGPVVTVCRSGRRSARAGAQLLAAGWTDVHSLAGGMEAWNEAGLSVEYAVASK